MLAVGKKKDGNKSILGFLCKSCEFFKAIKGLKVKKTSGEHTSPIKIVDKKADKLRSMSTTSAICPKCDSDTAYFWDGQTSSLEQASTQFFRCTTCSHTWRSL